MSLIKRMRKQKAVLWPANGFNSQGKPVVSAAEEIDCRWDSGVVRDANGAASSSSSSREAVVGMHTVYPDQAVPLFSLLRLGTLESIEGLETPDEIFEVSNSQAIPNLRNTETLYILTLKASHSEPDVVLGDTDVVVNFGIKWVARNIEYDAEPLVLTDYTVAEGDNLMIIVDHGTNQRMLPVISGVDFTLDPPDGLVLSALGIPLGDTLHILNYGPSRQ